MHDVQSFIVFAPPCMFSGVPGAPQIFRCASQCHIWCLCAVANLPVFHALRDWRLAVMTSTTLFHHQISCHHCWDFVVPHTPSPKLFFKTNFRLMQVKSITECSLFQQCFRPSLSYHLSLRSLFCLFLSGRFTQLLLYM